MFSEQNPSLIEFFQLTRYSFSYVIKLKNKYLKDGLKSLESKKKERKLGRLLTLSQREQIGIILNSKNPSDFWPGAQLTWSLSHLAALIMDLFNVKYKSKTSLHLLFKDSKLTFRKPEKINEKRDEKLVQEWRKKYLPILKEELTDKNNIVFVADESILTSATRFQKAFLSEGKTMCVEETSKRKMAHFYGFLDVQTGKVTAFRKAAQTGEITVSILKALVKQNQDKRIVIVWDNASWHKSKTVREYLETTDKIKLYNFPPYSPDQNPIEKVWKELKDKMFSNRLIKDFERVIKEGIDFLENRTFNYKFL